VAKVVANNPVSRSLHRQTQYMIIVGIDRMRTCIVIKIYLDRYLQQRSQQILNLVG